MRTIKLQFEIKLLLIFGSVLLVVLFLGPGNLSFEEAKSKAKKDQSSFSGAQLSKLKNTQARFTEVAFPRCLESINAIPDNFAVVIEIGPDGHVARSWRKGDSQNM